MNISLAFYKGTSGHTLKNRIFTKLIKVFTNCKYSHVELVIKQSDNPDSWMWYSSTDDGVRCGNIHFNEANWDFYNLDYFNTIDTVEFLDSVEFAPYDWGGILLSNVIKANLNDHSKWFCSEVVYAALVKGRYFDGLDAMYNPSTVTPKQLYNMVK